MRWIERWIDNPRRTRRVLWRVAWAAMALTVAILGLSRTLAERAVEGLRDPEPQIERQKPAARDPYSDDSLFPIWTTRLGDPPAKPTPPAAPPPVQVANPAPNLSPLLANFRLVACAPHSDPSRSSCILFDRVRGKQTVLFVGREIGDTGLRLADVGRDFIVVRKDGQILEVRLQSKLDEAVAKLNQEREGNDPTGPAGPESGPREPRFTREEVIAYFRSRAWQNSAPFGIRPADPAQRDGSPFERWLSLSPGSVILFINGDPVRSSSSVIAALNTSRGGEHTLVLRDTSGKQSVVFKTRGE